ncbi:MAG TPA: hypothetical protein VGJ57_01755 [Nitrospirales bacterium]|jgi:hypothetical protein
MKNILAIFVSSTVLLTATPALAERFTVDVRVVCPASVVSTPTGDVADPSFARANKDVPCAGLRVVAMDADPLWDEYCGAGYTDSTGHVSFSAECSDGFPSSSPPDVYLRIDARSLFGFSVGTHDYGFFDGLRDVVLAGVTFGAAIPVEVFNYYRSHATYTFLTPERQMGDNGVLAPGTIRIGGGFRHDSSSAVADMAAREFWAAQYSMARIWAGTQYHQMDFNYTVDAPIGTPTTLYDTILVDDDKITGSNAARSLNATPHEIGHVLYNTYHSGLIHWFTDGPDYMTNHGQCEDGHFMTLAWYEGFADFIRDYVFQRWDWPTVAWTVGPPYAGCAHNMPSQVDMHWEGNVEAFLNNVYFGPVSEAQRTAIAAPGPNDFTCPAGFIRTIMPDRSIRCEHRYSPNPCPSGQNLVIDANGTTDQCRERGGMSDAMYDHLLHSSACVREGKCPEPPIRSPIVCRGTGMVNHVQGRDDCLEVQRPSSVTAPGGAPVPRADGSPDLGLGFTFAGTKSWFALPLLDRVVEWVRDAGTNAHRAEEFWTQQIRPWCVRVRDGEGRAQYCNPAESRSFIEEMGRLDPAIR